MTLLLVGRGRGRLEAANAIRSLLLKQDDLWVIVLNVFQEFDAPDEGEHVSSDEF